MGLIILKLYYLFCSSGSFHYFSPNKSFSVFHPPPPPEQNPLDATLCSYDVPAPCLPMRYSLRDIRLEGKKSHETREWLAFAGLLPLIVKY